MRGFSDLTRIVMMVGALLAFGTQVKADSFTFDNGDVSGTMEISVSGNTLTAIVENTTASSADVIVAFGIELDDPEPSLVSWSLIGVDKDGETRDLGDEGLWVLTTSAAGNLDLSNVAATDDYGTDLTGGLYNPDYNTSGTTYLQNNDDPIFTTATWTLTFDDTPVPLYFAADGSQSGSPTMRFMGASDGGNIVGDGTTLNGVSATPTPEPGTIALIGLAIVAVGVRRRRRRQ
jgi:hypothetical protein